MAEYTFARPTDKDIEYVAAHLRQDNRQEWNRIMDNRRILQSLV